MNLNILENQRNVMPKIKTVVVDVPMFEHTSMEYNIGRGMVSPYFGMISIRPGFNSLGNTHQCDEVTHSLITETGRHITESMHTLRKVRAVITLPIVAPPSYYLNRDCIPTPHDVLVLYQRYDGRQITGDTQCKTTRMLY